MVLYRIMLCFLPDHQAKALVRLSKTGWGYRFYLCIVLYANLYSVSPIGLSQGFRDGPSSLALSCQPVFVVLCVWGGVPCRVTTCVRCRAVFYLFEAKYDGACGEVRCPSGPFILQIPFVV